MAPTESSCSRSASQLWGRVWKSGLGHSVQADGALSPCFVFIPDVTLSPLLIPSFSPTAVLFETASVGGGMFPKTKFDQHGSLGAKNDPLRLVPVGFSMVNRRWALNILGSRHAKFTCD